MASLALELTHRQADVLTFVVREYIGTSKPVSSSRVAQGLDLGLSSASLRIVMAQLEELGLLTHPHTSAGRVPSDRGYRYYVDHLMKTRSLSDREEEELSEALSEEADGLEGLFRGASRILAGLCCYPSVVLPPLMGDLICSSIDLVPLADNRILLVVTLEGHMMRATTMEPSSPIDRQDVEVLGSFLREVCEGRRCSALEAAVKERMGMKIFEERLRRFLVSATERAFVRARGRAILWDGAPWLVQHPEFGGIEEVGGLLRAMEDDGRLVELMESVVQYGGLAIKIGEELTPGPLDHCSLVASSYGIGGRRLGAIGIIGPRRMRYSKAASAVRSLSRVLSMALRDYEVVDTMN